MNGLDGDLFQIKIDVECLNHEKNDQQGSVSRHFRRKIYLSEDFDINKLTAKLSSDGLLIITAPKLKKKETKISQRKISNTNNKSQTASNNILKHKVFIFFLLQRLDTSQNLLEQLRQKILYDWLYTQLIKL